LAQTSVLPATHFEKLLPSKPVNNYIERRIEYELDQQFCLTIGLFMRKKETAKFATMQYTHIQWSSVYGDDYDGNTTRQILEKKTCYTFFGCMKRHE
jgi:hypothetical protein